MRETTNKKSETTLVTLNNDGESMAARSLDVLARRSDLGRVGLGAEAQRAQTLLQVLGLGRQIHENERL